MSLIKLTKPSVHDFPGRHTQVLLISRMTKWHSKLNCVAKLPESRLQIQDSTSKW